MLRALLALGLALALHAALLVCLSVEQPRVVVSEPTPALIEMDLVTKEAPPRQEAPTSLIVTPKGSSRPSPKSTRSSEVRAPEGDRELTITQDAEPIGDGDQPSRRAVGFYDPWMVDELPNPRSIPALSARPEGTRIELILTVAASGRVEGVAAPDSAAVAEDVASELRRMRFRPAAVGDDAVSTTVTITLLFGPEDAGVGSWKRSSGGWTITAGGMQDTPGTATRRND